MREVRFVVAAALGSGNLRSFKRVFREFHCVIQTHLFFWKITLAKATFLFNAFRIDFFIKSENILIVLRWNVGPPTKYSNLINLFTNIYGALTMCQALL